jgi:iron complex transport system substrate-binding protein
VEWWPKPVIAPGRKSWVTDLIDAAGGVNPFDDRPVESIPLTDDDAVRAQPDAIVISWCGVKTEKYRPHVVHRRSAWSTLPALVNDRVFCVAEAYLGRPGPRLVEGYRALRQIVDSCDTR